MALDGTPHTVRHLRDELLISGENFTPDTAATLVGLTPLTAFYTLAECAPTTATGMHLALPTGLEPGDYTLTVTNAAGQCSTGCTATEEGSQRYNSTSKKMEFCNGTEWAKIGDGGLKSMQVFVSDGTWTKPAGITRIEVILTGGGGGGGSHNTDDAQGGGGAGGTAIKIMDVSAISSVTVTIGTGGTGACGNSSNGGTAGSTSSFGSYSSATGGSPPSTWAVGGLGGVGVGGDLNLRGNDGGTGNIDGGGNEESGGTGGSSFWGGGGTGGSVWGSRRNGVHGSVGGGTHANTNNCGSVGGTGIVVVREFG